jgi:hypothetical protein
VLWTERFPGRLEYELEDYGRRGLADFKLDEQEYARGRVVIGGSTLVEDEAIRLRVVYPDLFPYFRPEVFAPDLTLGRHQNPYERSLCLLEAATRAWRTTETGAWLVAERVPYLLGLLKGDPADLEANEVPQGEPASYYIPRLEGTAVFLPGSLLELPEDANFGTAYFSFRSDRVGTAVHLLLRQVNAQPKHGGGKRLAVADEELQTRFEGLKIEGRWVRLPEPLGREPEAYFAAAEDIHAGFGSPPWQAVGNDRIAVLGVVFKEEVQQGVWEDAWLFAVRAQQSRPAQTGIYLTKGERFASQDLEARIPRLAGLRERSVSLLGLGSLGAPIALELARAQLRNLKILDFDIVEGGTIVRWPFGVPSVGAAKTKVIEATIANQYPYTRCSTVNRQLGVARDAPGEPGDNDFDILEQFFEDTDLVIDATAETAVQQLVADLANERDLPQLYVWGTEGAFGGAVARIVPGTTGCWFCLQLRIDDKSLPAPPLELSGKTQPRGCGQPTFTGESFNLLPLVAQATRTAVGTLLGTLEPGHDYFVLSLRDGDEAAPTPNWTSHTLLAHPACPYCSGS